MKGNDWLYLGLGIGALILVTKLGKSVESIGETISDDVGALNYTHWFNDWKF